MPETFRLPKDFVPGPDDVICGRGKICYAHEGNLRLREMVRRKTKEYSMTKSKEEKSAIVTDIADAVRMRSPNGGFVKQDSKGWYEVGAFLAREKISQAFRDVLHHRYKSSTNARRRNRQANRKCSMDDNSSTNASREEECQSQSKNTIEQYGVSRDDAIERSYQEAMIAEVNLSTSISPLTSPPTLRGNPMQEGDSSDALSTTQDHVDWHEMPFRDYHSLPDFDNGFTGRTHRELSYMELWPHDAMSMPEHSQQDSALLVLNEAAQKLHAMDDIRIDPNQIVALDNSIIDPVPLQRIFRREEAWERKSAP